MQRVDYSKLTERRCSACKQVKPISEFGTYKDSSQPINGWRYYSRCIPCALSASRRYGVEDRERRNRRISTWRKQNPDAARSLDRRKKLKHLYDLTAEEAAAMIEKQNGRCAICDAAKNLVIDHDHQTGVKRAAICTRCNVSLGQVEANRSRVLRTELGQAMIAYLIRHGSRLPPKAQALANGLDPS